MKAIWSWRNYLIVLVLFSDAVFSRGAAENLEVDFVRVDKSGKGYVQFVSPLTPDSGSLPSCGTSYPKALAFDTNVAGGDAILSVALSAKMSSKKITARGTNTCGTYSTIENWDWGYIK